MNARIATLAGVVSTDDGTYDGFTMHDHAADDWDGSPELRPYDQILRDAATGSAPEPPDGLCHRTLERCFARPSRSAEALDGMQPPAAL